MKFHQERRQHQAPSGGFYLPTTRFMLPILIRKQHLKLSTSYGKVKAGTSTIIHTIANVIFLR